MRLASLLFVVIFLLLIPSHAQVNVGLELERSYYLLYEPVKAKVTVFNNTDHDISLTSTEGHSWMSFLMTRRDGRSVRPDNAASFTPTQMKAGEARAWVVNLTPLLSFRELGEYKVRAVLDLSGTGELLSSPVSFSVGRGQTIQRKSRPWDGSERIFSLVRFSPANDSTALYASVDDARENVVYATFSLGEIIAMTDPETMFDREGTWHILHVTGSQTYRYSQVSPDGKLIFQDNYTSFNGNLPTLVPKPDGTVQVQGGQAESENKPRVRLSETQSVLPAPKAPAPLPTIPPPAAPATLPNPQ